MHECGILTFIICHIVFASKKPGIVITPSPTPPPQPNFSTSRQPVSWCLEEEEQMIALVKRYQYNWELVADSLNAQRGPMAVDRKSAWDCYDRWFQKENQTMVSPGGVTVQNRPDISPGGLNAVQNAIIGSSVKPKKDQFRRLSLKYDAMTKKR